LAKPSTGYAFLHMYRDAQYLADYFAQHQTFPKKLRRTPWRYRFFDTLLLDIMAREGNDIRRIFGHLFRNNPTARVFDFLSERSTLTQDFQVMASVPPWPFLRAIPRVFWSGWRG
jgi:lycopene beta-cyclase